MRLEKNSKHNNHKKGFFFIIDTLLAIIIIFGGLVLILAGTTQTTLTAQAALTAQDLLRQLGSTRINESSDVVIIAARFNGTIPASDNYRSILEEVVYLTYQNRNATASQIINSSAASLIPAIYNAQFLINNSLLYNRSVNTNTQASSPFILKDRRIVIGLTNTSQRFGPYVVEFAIWQ